MARGSSVQLPPGDAQGKERVEKMSRARGVGVGNGRSSCVLRHSLRLKRAGLGSRLTCPMRSKRRQPALLRPLWLGTTPNPHARRVTCQD